MTYPRLFPGGILTKNSKTVVGIMVWKMDGKIRRLGLDDAGKGERGANS